MTAFVDVAETARRLLRRAMIAAGAALVVALAAIVTLMAEISTHSAHRRAAPEPRIAPTGVMAKPSEPAAPVAPAPTGLPGVGTPGAGGHSSPATGLQSGDAMTALPRAWSDPAETSAGIAGLPAFRAASPPGPGSLDSPLSDGIEHYKKKAAAEDVANLTGFIISTSLGGASAIADWMAVLTEFLIEERVVAAVRANNGEGAQIVAELRRALSSLAAQPAVNPPGLPTPADFAMPSAPAGFNLPALPQPPDGLPGMPTLDQLTRLLPPPIGLPQLPPPPPIGLPQLPPPPPIGLPPIGLPSFGPPSITRFFGLPF